MHSLSYENEFSFTCRLNLFPYERLCTRPRFEKEAQDNWEMAYWLFDLKVNDSSVLSAVVLFP